MDNSGVLVPLQRGLHVELDAGVVSLSRFVFQDIRDARQQPSVLLIDLNFPFYMAAGVLVMHYMNLPLEI